MSKTDTTIRLELSGEENDKFKRLVEWFNRWLEVPLSDREKTIIGETLGYIKKAEAVDGRYKNGTILWNAFPFGDHPLFYRRGYRNDGDAMTQTTPGNFADRPFTDDEREILFEKIGEIGISQHIFQAPPDKTIGQIRKEFREIIYGDN